VERRRGRYAPAKAKVVYFAAVFQGLPSAPRLLVVLTERRRFASLPVLGEG
jgi:hypothetical protein